MTGKSPVTSFQLLSKVLDDKRDEQWGSRPSMLLLPLGLRELLETGRHILLVSSSKTRVPPKGRGAPLTLRLCSLSGPLSLSDLLFSAVLLSSACKGTDTGIKSRIKHGLLAGESVPDPVPTQTCKNCLGKVSKTGEIGFWGPESN